ncbi:sugar phosphate isomerase/epimerase [Microbacterium trichothecenolyticum]|uniref:sugar phosphate isomerase/epimerase family protein n=1 Tax=Microbacterium trichothecenolyticum TaxID=69370 RepID=UPI00285826C4|nr:TIM barrel protein [Microbacterium trichothecenolyticum]MDR7187129.1 sugar phosphate isomerase/epimerase [Microbacterium trichothecenolyticum]
MLVPYSASEWPIATCLHGVPATTVSGRPLHDASAEEWREALDLVSSVGFSIIELADSHARIGDMTSLRLSEIKSAFDDAGVSAPSVHVQRRSVIQPGAGEDNLAYVHRTIEAAAEWGMSVVSTGLHQPFSDAQQRALWFWTEAGPSDPDDREVWSLAVGRLRELGRHAGDIGLSLSLEMYEDTYLGTADSAVRLIEDIDLPNVGLNPDIGNLVRLHRPIEDWREAYAKTLPYANYWHLKNYARDEIGEFYTSSPTTLAAGIINYRQVISDAVRGGYRGILLMEHYGGDSLGVCATNRDYVRSALTHPLNQLARADAAHPTTTR